MKRSDGFLKTTAYSALFVGELVSYAPFSDFNRVLNSSGGRCTKKLVETLHLDALNQIELIIQLANRFYLGETV